MLLSTVGFEPTPFRTNTLDHSAKLPKCDNHQLLQRESLIQQLHYSITLLCILCLIIYDSNKFRMKKTIINITLISRFMAASVAQQAARQSHNLKAVSSNLTGGKTFQPQTFEFRFFAHFRTNVVNDHCLLYACQEISTGKLNFKVPTLWGQIESQWIIKYDLQTAQLDQETIYMLIKLWPIGGSNP